MQYIIKKKRINYVSTGIFFKIVQANSINHIFKIVHEGKQF